MIRFVALLFWSFVSVALAQPAEPPPGGGLWERLTQEQRQLLWRSLTPEQKAELWGNLAPSDRRAMRERPLPDAPDAGRRRMPHGTFESGDAPPRMMMTPEERQRMREQIREAHRLRRERLEAERQSRRGRD